VSFISDALLYLRLLFIQSDLQNKNKAINQGPTIAVVHNAWFIRQLD